MVAVMGWMGWAVSARAAAESLARRPEVAAVLNSLRQAESRTLEEQVRICEIPAPPFHEEVRGDYVRRRFLELKLTEVRVDREGNVIGLRPGRSEGPVVVFSAHLDTVFPAGTDVTVTRTGTVLKAPGIADDSRGLAVMLAVAEALQRSALRTESTVAFVATVGEEGLGDLRGVKHLFAQELAGRIAHFISLDGTGLGAVNVAVGSNRYKVTFRSAGGHSYGQFGLVNPVHALGRAVEKIARIEVPEAPKTTFNVGRIEGGTSVNAIAENASLEIDLRSSGVAELAALDTQFRTAVSRAVEEENAFWKVRARNPLARTANERQPLTAEIEALGRRPSGRVPEPAPILDDVRRADAALGIATRWEEGSTDSNLPISLGIPAVTLRSGGSSGGTHALQEYFDSKDSHLGTQRALLVLLEIAGVAP